MLVLFLCEQIGSQVRSRRRLMYRFGHVLNIPPRLILFQPWGVVRAFGLHPVCLVRALGFCCKLMLNTVIYCSLLWTFQFSANTSFPHI